MPTTVTIEISPGELIDKITILEIKAERVHEAQRRAYVLKELALLRRSCADLLRAAPPEVEPTTRALRATNERLWEVEDALRDCERAGCFDERFVGLARSVYRTNDQRAALKSELNRLLGSALHEVKSYAAY